MIFLKSEYYKWIWQAFLSSHVKFHVMSFARNTKVAPYTHLDSGVLLARCEIGSYSYVSKGTTMVQARVGRYCSIAPECRIGMASHATDLLSTSPIFFSKSNKIDVSLVDEDCYKEFDNIEIGNDVWIGARVMIMGGCRIGNGSIVAAGSVVTKDVEPFSIVGGVPARKIRSRFDESLVVLLEKSKWWEYSHTELKNLANLHYENSNKWSGDEIEKLCIAIIDLEK